MNHVVAAMARRSVSVVWRLVLAGVGASVIFSHVGLAQASDEKSGTHWLRKCTDPEPVWQIECAIYVHQAVVEYDEAGHQPRERNDDRAVPGSRHQIPS
jgi:hypothetical protein